MDVAVGIGGVEENFAGKVPQRAGAHDRLIKLTGAINRDFKYTNDGDLKEI